MITQEEWNKRVSYTKKKPSAQLELIETGYPEEDANLLAGDLLEEGRSRVVLHDRTGKIMGFDIWATRLPNIPQICICCETNIVLNDKNVCSNCSRFHTPGLIDLEPVSIERFHARGK